VRESRKSNGTSAFESSIEKKKSEISKVGGFTICVLPSFSDKVRKKSSSTRPEAEIQFGNFWTRGWPWRNRSSARGGGSLGGDGKEEYS